MQKEQVITVLYVVTFFSLLMTGCVLRYSGKSTVHADGLVDDVPSDENVDRSGEVLLAAVAELILGGFALYLYGRRASSNNETIPLLAIVDNPRLFSNVASNGIATPADSAVSESEDSAVSESEDGIVLN